MTLGSKDAIANEGEGKGWLKEQPLCYLDQTVARKGLERGTSEPRRLPKFHPGKEEGKQRQGTTKQGGYPQVPCPSRPGRHQVLIGGPLKR